MRGVWAGAAALACLYAPSSGAERGRVRQTATFTATAYVEPFEVLTWETDEVSGEARIRWATNAPFDADPPQITVEIDGRREYVAIAEPGRWLVVPSPAQLLARRSPPPKPVAARPPTRRTARPKGS